MCPAYIVHKAGPLAQFMDFVSMERGLIVFAGKLNAIHADPGAFYLAIFGL